MGKQQVGESTAGGSGRSATVELPIPVRDENLFKHAATSDVLGLLVDNPYETYTIRALARITDNSTYAIKSAVDVLEANGLVVTEREGNRRPVGINRSRLRTPDDPVLRIPQPEFHEPVHEALDRIRQELNEVRGVLVFGSVARGTADRQSDIDLWVLVEGSSGEQHRANELAKELGGEHFDGDRYEFQILVESVRSARGYREELADIFTEGITLHDSDTLREVKDEVLGDA